jgi:predicted nucleic acid-binding protein
MAMHRPRLVLDTLLAATAEVHGLTLATRNTQHVSDLPIAHLNPWLPRGIQQAGAFVDRA